VKKGKENIQNELDNLPPIEDLQISVPEVLCNPLGKVINISLYVCMCTHSQNCKIISIVRANGE